tara:strand:- start:1289 stop:1531 length:243 start_codon:yes stop_codon:yes gene_type:complete
MDIYYLKELIMCIGGSPPSPPRNIQAEQQQAEQSAQQTESKKTARQEALNQKVAGIRGGTGRRSLIKSSGGGMGYYSEYN